MVVKVQGTDVLRGVLDQWQAGVDAHEPQKVASVFTKDAIFQGLRPYSVLALVLLPAAPALLKPTVSADGEITASGLELKCEKPHDDPPR
jgi:hypothetical protein